MRDLDQLLKEADALVEADTTGEKDYYYVTELMEELIHHVKGYRARRAQDRTVIFEQWHRIGNLRYEVSRLGSALNQPNEAVVRQSDPERLATELRRRATLLRADDVDAAQIALPWLLNEAADLIDKGDK